MKEQHPSTHLFDKVLVISLCDSHERREHVRKHLPRAGFHEFEFIDATPASDPAVANAYKAGEVFSYPPCFRCGELDCGRPDCNNYLIPAQVATFLTYKKLWQTIADGTARRVLVVEDDVQFQPYAREVLEWLVAEVEADRIPFTPGRECLLRLGWAFCDDHAVDSRACRVSDAVKMSNPCHALTREFAKALLERYDGINHTADVFQHQLAPRQGEAFTVFPPIAAELSWTSGVFASTIHPKKVHEEYLRENGQSDAAEAYGLMLSSHVKKKHFRNILIAGHPRCGTGQAASLCRQLGLDVGHEKLGADGISSWMFAVEADSNPYALDEVSRTRRAFAWRHMVMPVRNILDAVPSVMRESTYAPPSHEFRRYHIREQLDIDLDARGDEFEQAIWSVTSWTRIILSQDPDCWFRIEDQNEKLRAFLLEQGLVPAERKDVALSTEPVNANKKYKGVRYPKPVVAREQWLALDAETTAEINWYCSTFGYPLPWEVEPRVVADFDDVSA